MNDTGLRRSAVCAKINNRASKKQTHHQKESQCDQFCQIYSVFHFHSLKNIQFETGKRFSLMRKQRKTSNASKIQPEFDKKRLFYQFGMEEMSKMLQKIASWKEHFVFTLFCGLPRDDIIPNRWWFVLKCKIHYYSTPLFLVFFFSNVSLPLRPVHFSMQTNNVANQNETNG